MGWNWKIAQFSIPRIVCVHTRYLRDVTNPCVGCRYLRILRQSWSLLLWQNVKSAATSRFANASDLALLMSRFHRTFSTYFKKLPYVPVLMYWYLLTRRLRRLYTAVVWRVYGGSHAEVALCSARILISTPCEQRYYSGIAVVFLISSGGMGRKNNLVSAH